MNYLSALLGLLPSACNLKFEHIVLTSETATVVLRTIAASATCPRCGQASRRVHSCYQRKLADLPSHGKTVVIQLHARRFFCTAAACDRKIFVERLPALARAYARTTARLCQAHGQIGLALGGEAGARLAHHLAMPTSPDTLLRRVKQFPGQPAPCARIVGIDDWAWKKRHRYGTILIDLERSQVLDLLPDRDSATVQAWLKNRPEIEVISRDRAGTYAQAASAAAPQAKQVADRWHLLKNLREAVERLFEHSSSAIKQALATLPPRGLSAEPPSPNPAAQAAPALARELPALSRLQQARQIKHGKRVERHQRVRQLHAEGQSIRRIAVMLGLNRGTVRRYLRDEQCPNWQSGRPRRTGMDGYRRYVDQRLEEGCRNAAALHRQLAREGHRVPYHVVRRFVRRRLADLGKPRRVDVLRPPRAPSARQLAFAWIRRHEERAEQEQGQLDAVRQTNTELSAALDLADEFAGMARKTLNQPLSDWLDKAERCSCSELRGFARSLRQDEAAVAAALSEHWSNGKVEGHVNRLKVIKRQMYGRAGFRLLRARVMNAA